MDLSQQAILIYTLAFLSVFIMINNGWRTILRWWINQEQHYDRVLNFQLLMNVNTRLAMVMTILGIGIFAAIGHALGGLVWFFPFAIAGFLFPFLVMRHLDQKRRERLDAQLVDGLTTLSSGVRAGLTLIQSMELLVQNLEGPIKQEFAQLLKEYQMGMDLNQAMRNASNRIRLQNYRLVFTAIEMHRIRGGNTGESLDRIAESVREIQRLEGKLDALTAQGRYQAIFIAGMPFLLLFIYSLMEPKSVALLFSEPVGRVLLLVCAMMVLGGFLWIRKIMRVDI